MPTFSSYFFVNKYGKVIFISSVHFLQISISFKREVPIRFNMGSSYLFNIYMINMVGWVVMMVVY